MLSFAWEKGNFELINVACAKIVNSQALVIIGYSFPFFNREVDTAIIQVLSSNPRLKIYVQDRKPMDVVQKLESGFLGDRAIKVIPIDTIDQFHLPRNYNHWAGKKPL